MNFSSSTDSHSFVYDMALAAEACRVTVEEEIAKQIRLLCDLQTQRNSFLPISRLPTETLTAIFICSARDYHDTDDGCPTRTAPSWVNVSYVCRRWRNVALNCATLWSYLFITSPRWTEELLARSKQASLKLHAEVYWGYSRASDRGDRGLSSVRQVMNHTERIQELHLSLPCKWFTNHFRSSPAPCLQNLKLSGLYQEGPSQEFSAFFDGDTPALRTLELSSCPVPWYSFTLNGLTTLDLHSVPSRCRQNMVEFLATLSCAQDLRHLYLQDALASTSAGSLSSTEFHSFQKINLPCLSRLLIAAPLSTVIAFLAGVNIPMKTEVRLDCHVEDDVSLHDYASLFSVAAQRFSTSTSQELASSTFRSLIIQLGYSVALTFSSLEHDSCDLVLQQDWGCNPSLKIRVQWFMSDTGSNLDCIMDDISSFVPLMDIQSVHVIKPPVLPAIWRSVLGHLQDLRFLKLSSGDLPDLVPLLSLTDRTTSKGAEGQGGHTNRSLNWMLVPALEELELYDISFRKRTKKDKCPVDVQALCDALAARKGSSGQVTVTRGTECIRRGKSVQKKHFNMVGSWKNGCFRVEKHILTTRNVE